MAKIKILNIADRTGQFFATYKVPELVAGKKFIITTDSATADLQDETRTLKFNIYISNDNVNFDFLAGFTYKGYVEISKGYNRQPGLILSGDKVAGKWIKVECETNKPWNVGLQVETVL